MRKNKKVTMISLAMAGMLAVATAVTGLFSGIGVKNTSAATVTVGTPAHDATLPAVLSNEEFYRLLYVNDVERRNDVALEFQAYGYESDEIEYLKNGLALQGKANMGLLALNTVTGFLAKNNADSFLPSVSTVGKLVKAFNTATSVYQVNINNAEMFNQLSGQLEDVYGALSKDIATQTDLLQKDLTNKTTYLADTFKQQEYADTLKAFNTTAFFEREGEIQKSVGYYRWKQLLLDKYNTLQARMETNASDSLVREAYDLLYEIAAQESVLFEYMLGGTYASGEDVSIQEILYQYNLLRWQNESDYDLDQGIADCIEFSEELYNTYLFSQVCLTVCYQYQADEVSKTMGETEKFQNMSYYLFNDTANPIVVAEKLLPFAQNPTKNTEILAKELCNYFSRVLNLEQVYFYDYSNYSSKMIYNEITTTNTHKSTVVKTAAGEQKDYYRSINDSVRKGYKLYLSTVPTALTQNLGLDFSFRTSDESKATVTKDGTVSVVGDSGHFTVEYLANGTPLYSMTFTIGADNGYFSGGLGTTESPYVIATEADLKTLAGNSSYWNKHFRLYKDITLSASVGQIGSHSTPFTGTFVGKGYSIKNVTNRALFGKNDGVIEDLTLENANVTTGQQSNPIYIAGGIVEWNNGTVRNCRILNSKVDASYTPSSNDINAGDGYYNSVSIFVGGICGVNYGTVTGCEVRGCTVKGYIKNPSANGGGAPDSVNGYVGGLIGVSTGGLVVDGLAVNNTVDLKIAARS
ncbi:MAG: hypothetical protein IJB97_02565, partial [Clostridia bacterium]|nr:hypothetical protein [Clostridia bacterium]